MATVTDKDCSYPLETTKQVQSRLAKSLCVIEEPTSRSGARLPWVHPGTRLWHGGTENRPEESVSILKQTRMLRILGGLYFS